MRILRRADEIVTVPETDLLPDGDADVSYDLRRLTRDISATIARKHTAKRANKITRAMEDVSDATAIGSDVIDYVIVDWRGWEDSDGQPLPCTTANKLLLPQIIQTAIANWAWDAERRSRDDSFREPDGVAGVVDDGAGQASVLPDR